jgi:hypothetical protein
VKRLELRKYKDENNDKRKICGAITEAAFHDSAKNTALEAAFYIIEQASDTVKIQCEDTKREDQCPGVAQTERTNFSNPCPNSAKRVYA